MENLNNLNQELEGTENLNTDAPETVEGNKKVWLNAAGEEVSMSAFIREKFLDENMSRKEISEEYDINYRTVYGATLNLENSAEGTSRGRGASNPKITLTAEGQVYICKKVKNEDGSTSEIHLLDGKECDADVVAGLELTETDRNTYVTEQIEAGVSRGDIAEKLDVSYGVVYNLTKDASTGRGKHVVVLEDGTEVPRAEYIRTLAAEGMSKTDIAAKLGVDYSVVWQATKKEKTVQEKFDDAKKNIAKFLEYVEDQKAFQKILDKLDDLVIPEKEEATEEAEVETTENIEA